MESTYIPLVGKEYDVEITKISKDGKKFGMRVTSSEGLELTPENDRPTMQKIADIIRAHHPEVIAQAKMRFSGRMTESQKLADAIERAMNGEWNLISAT